MRAPRPVLTIILTIALLTAPFVADAQQTGIIHRIGILPPGPISERIHLWEAFRQGLQERGYVEGQNIALEFPSGEGGPERLAHLAAELVRLKVDVIVTSGIPGALAAKRATTTIPIVVAGASDLRGAGLVASLARPGGNLTGNDSLTAELSGKRLELLKEVLPRLSRVGALWNQLNPGAIGTWEQTQAAARALRLQLLSLPVRGPDELEAAFLTGVKRGAEALVIVQDSLTLVHRTQIAQLAAKSRLPAVYGSDQFVGAGGLMSYGPNQADMFRRAATFVDKILKGAKPGDLPIEQPTKFELIVNLRSAKALGLTIPPSVLARADEIIQ